MYSNDIIQKNRTKVFLYMAGMTAFIGILGYFISEHFDFGLTGTGVFLIIAGIIDFIAYFFSDTLVIKSANAKPIMRETLPEYYDLVKDLCEKNNIQMPKLYMVNNNSINAFATGRNKSRAVVAVTRGLLEKLSPDEIRGVVGHELSHIEGGDMLLMSALSILVGFISILADLFWYSSAMNRVSSRDNSGVTAIIGIILSLFAPITATLIKLSVSRTREYSADANGAKICGNPIFLADALCKIKKDRIPLPYASKATAHLYFASPFKQDLFEELFSTHPNIDERIKRLREMQI